MPIRTPKLRQHKGSGQALVCLDGKRIYLGRWGTPQAEQEYRRMVAEWLSRGAAEPPKRGPAVEPAKPVSIPIAELCVAYLRHAEKWYRKDGKVTGTIYTVRSAVRALDALYGERDAAEFTATAFDVVLASLAEQKLSRPYVNSLAAVIKQLFRWGARQRLVPVAAWHEAQLVENLQQGRTDAYEPSPVEPVTESVVDATLPHLPSVVKDMIELQRATGARPGEICILRPCDLDRSADVWTFKPHRHKLQHKGLDRTVYIGPAGQAVLLKYLLREPTAYCFSPREAMVEVQANRRERRKTRVQPSQRCRRKARPKRQPGERYTTQSYGVAIQRAALRADKQARREHPSAEADKRLVPGWSPNQLRHLAATTIRAEFGLEAAAAILGHTRVSTTEIYAQANKQRAVEVVGRIG